MTKALRPDDPSRQRRARACKGCRASKAKCDGKPATYDSTEVLVEKQNPCKRCVRLHVDCQWLPSRRKGRPRRILRDEAGNPLPAHRQSGQVNSNGNGSTKKKEAIRHTGEGEGGKDVEDIRAFRARGEAGFGIGIRHLLLRQRRRPHPILWDILFEFRLCIVEPRSFSSGRTYLYGFSGTYLCPVP
ncbi:hypothetical protein BT69DRAFT_1118041 [Atractiella rhizophila]|nr:hypothetical protein BT69DRAFT_1118041 [Atractiella rhizophila]